MSEISDACEGREGKGRWKVTGGRGEESERAANCVNKTLMFFFFFPLFLAANLTFCSTASRRLIHTSAGMQYLQRNYSFPCYLGLSPIIGSEVPPLHKKAKGKSPGLEY